jgi:hypothetical protein
MGFDEGTTERSALEAYAIPYLTETEEEKVSPDGAPLPESAPGKIKGEKVKISYPSQNGERGGSFTLYLGGETVDENVIKEADKKNNGDVWLSGKTMYIKQNGDVYELVDENGRRMSESYGEAYAYFTENKTPDSDFFEKAPEDAKIKSIKDGVVSYTDSTGEEKRAAAVPLSRLYWTPDLEKYKYNDNVIFESDGRYHIWQNGNLYALLDIVDKSSANNKQNESQNTAESKPAVFAEHEGKSGTYSDANGNSYSGTLKFTQNHPIILQEGVVTKDKDGNMYVKIDNKYYQLIP